MTTKITGLSALNVRALRETMPQVETTATTATFHGNTPAQALEVVRKVIASLSGGNAHPRGSLHAVARKLKAQVLNGQQTVPQDDARRARGAKLVIDSVRVGAGQYGGEIIRENSVTADLEFPSVGKASDYVYTYQLEDVATIVTLDARRFNTPVLITFPLETYAQIHGLMY